MREFAKKVRARGASVSAMGAKIVFTQRSTRPYDEDPDIIYNV